MVIYIMLFNFNKLVLIKIKTYITKFIKNKWKIK